MKKLIIIAALAVTAAILIGCAGKDYSDSVPCRALLDAAKEKTHVEMGYESYDSEYVRSYFDSSLFEDCDVRYSVLTEDINEFGVFRAKDKKSAKKLKNGISDYLGELRTDKRAFIESYAPDQLPKLDNAEVRRYGNYVVYAILPDGERTEFFGSVENMLKQ